MNTLGILGCGNMGGALGRAAAQSIPGLKLVCYDTAADKAAALAAATGGSVAASPEELCREAGTILVALKPQILAAALSGLPVEDKLCISIAAGIKLEKLAAAAPAARWIRVMPNTPALVGEGVLGWTPGPTATAADEARFTEPFAGSGSLHKFAEPLLDTVTGLSGSGPAYVFTMINALAEGAVLDGMGKEDALQLAARTVLGAAKMVLESGLHPELLKDQVTSPGGTTAAGLALLEERGMRSAFSSAVRRAAERARELGR